MTKRKQAGSKSPQKFTSADGLTFTKVGRGSTEIYKMDLSSDNIARLSSLMGGMSVEEMATFGLQNFFSLRLENLKSFAFRILAQSNNEKVDGLFEILDALDAQSVDTASDFFSFSDNFQAHVDPEWYALEILCLVFQIQGAIKFLNEDTKKEACAIAHLALHLGGLAEEAYTRKFYGMTGKESRPKGSPYRKLARYLVKKKPTASAKVLWDMIPVDDEIKIGGYKFYRSGSRVRATTKSKTKSKPATIVECDPISFRSFNNLITSEKQNLAIGKILSSAR